MAHVAFSICGKPHAGGLEAGAGPGAVVDTHDDDEGDATGEVVPVEHIVQLVAAATAAYCPTAQAAHEVEPVVDAKVPTTQSVQLTADKEVENLPDAQYAQTAVPNWPAGQITVGAGAGAGAGAAPVEVQADDPATEVSPAAQLVHKPEPATA